MTPPTDTSPTPSSPELWTVDDIADFLRVSVRTVGNYRQSDPDFPKARVLPGHRSVRWFRDDVVAWFHALDLAA